jgi:hypothetical protein
VHAYEFAVSLCHEWGTLKDLGGQKEMNKLYFRKITLKAELLYTHTPPQDTGNRRKRKKMKVFKSSSYNMDSEKVKDLTVLKTQWQ